MAAIRIWSATGRNNYCTAKKLGITTKVLREWCRHRAQIEDSKEGSRRRHSELKNRPQYPLLEEMVYTKFTELRELGHRIKSHWFYAQARSYFELLWPWEVTINRDGDKVYGAFKFSERWFMGFKRRHGISLRRLTNKAQVIPEKKETAINDFHQFIRKKALPNIRKGEGWKDVGKFELGNIANVDQTPMPFEFLSGSTYAQKGSRTFWAKSLGSGLDKRQCTVQLCVHADGVARSKPLILFHGKGKRLGNEPLKWDPRISVMFNEKAWVDTTARHWSVPYFSPRMLVLDCHRVHLTGQVLDRLNRQYTLPAVVPEGCTSLVQPLDVIINKTFKDLVDRCYQKHYQENLDEWVAGKVTAREQRILITKWVGTAWEKLHYYHSATIRKSFRMTGISISISDEKDDEIKIRGLEEYQVRNWRDNPKFNFDATDVLEKAFFNSADAVDPDAFRLSHKDRNEGAQYCSDEECPYAHPTEAATESYNNTSGLTDGLPVNEARDLDGILEHVDTTRVPVIDGEFEEEADGEGDLSDEDAEYVLDDELNKCYGSARGSRPTPELMEWSSEHNRYIM
ncbi:hypothetical protein BJ508DRAFT_329449 [Ascobolus immersus RN42]|uniref:HTH CENPB-type domain-containing protein n=1 Tax=Ascobolus immersus RN42 TaxID=1160509 RepID=A0A3N4I0E2_ASCIM|nr:hypothetical protein BJ508DRAFT_329449 [Ascobolus immersus RN42]